MINKIAVIPEAVNDSFIDEVFKSKTELFDGYTGLTEAKKDDRRKSKICFLNGHVRHHKIYSVLSDIFYEANKSVFNYDIDHIETVQFTEYTDQYAGKFDEHTDSFNELIDGEWQRKLSISIQLTDPSEYQGGDLVFTEFDEQFDTKKKGTAIVFSSFAKHKVTPVTKGCRHSLVSWCLGPDFR